MIIMDSYIAAFPGRDAFYKGLSKSFYNEYLIVRSIFEEADTFLGENLEKISYENPQARPELHTVCLITHCYAIYNVISQIIGKPVGAIGFSHGEFTALTAAGSINFPQVLELVYRLEKLLNEFTDITRGRMVRIVGLDVEELEGCCRHVDGKGQNVSVAIYLSDNQNIISGEDSAVEEVTSLAKKKGARWAIRLDSTGAFHSPLCREALSKSEAIFDEYCFSDSMFPVYSCVDGKGSVTGADLKTKLSVQIAEPVKWNKIITNIKGSNITKLLELGPGCTVSGNTRLVDSNMDCIWINSTRNLLENC